MNALLNIFRIAELRARLLYTIALLAVYRLGIFINTPGIDRYAMNQYMTEQRKSGGLLNLFNLFSGGALDQMSIFGLSIMPYVSASIIMQLLTEVLPTLKQIQKEGAAGRQKINQYTRYGTIVLSIIQGGFISRYLYSIGRVANQQEAIQGMVVPNSVDPVWFTFMTIITLTAGTAFIMWLGERITENGIGNGISMIIFAGIVARIPSAGQLLVNAVQAKNIQLIQVITLLFFMVIVIAAVVYIERGMRRIPVQYAKRAQGQQGQVFAQSSYFPIKVNASGVIPPIFAGAVLSFPATLANWVPGMDTLQSALQQSSFIYNGLFVAMIVFFAYFYTSLTFRADDVADNIKKQGGYIPGIRPGRQTADFIERVLNRLTFGGAIYLATICILPQVISTSLGISFPFGGTALLIVVGVALDTVQQVEQHLISRNYEGFAGPRGPRIRGRVRLGEAV